MPRILIIGATGYLGIPLALALLRNNHTVYGLASTPAKASFLATQEVIPILGTASDSGAYTFLIESQSINLIIDCSTAHAGSAQILEDLIRVGKRRLEQHPQGPRLGFIYTSGTYVHGSHLPEDGKVSDLDPVGEVPGAKRQPPELVAWRPELERKVLAARDILNVLILRPALLYGRDCPIWSSLFLIPLLAAKNANAPFVELPAEGDAMPGLIHVDDTVSAFVAAAEKIEMLGSGAVYPVFNLVGSTEGMKGILEGFARGMEYNGEVKCVGAGEDVFARALSCSLTADTERAHSLLGWEPRRRGMREIVRVLGKAFEASKG